MADWASGASLVVILTPGHIAMALTEARQQVIGRWCQAHRPGGHGAGGQLRDAVLAEAALEVVRRDPGAEQLTLNIAAAALETYEQTAPRPRTGRSRAEGPPGPAGGPAPGGADQGGPGPGGSV